MVSALKGQCLLGQLAFFAEGDQNACEGPLFSVPRSLGLFFGIINSQSVTEVNV